MVLVTSTGYKKLNGAFLSITLYHFNSYHLIENVSIYRAPTAHKKRAICPP